MGVTHTDAAYMRKAEEEEDPRGLKALCSQGSSATVLFASIPSGATEGVTHSRNGLTLEDNIGADRY